MKIFGYIDNTISWQINVGWWNLLIIPIEFIIIKLIIDMCRSRTPL